ncbi:hypothetical protein Btru_038833 [Bulinus truncatus]|nr:hypothetical protein Btru_038833 [Bulinus truncatus]
MLINVIDTPGLMDTRMSNEVILQNIFNAMSFCPEGINALVYVMKYNDRYTEEEKQVLYFLKQAFGEAFVRDFCIVIMTGGDQFELQNEDREDKGEGYTFDHWLNEQTGPPEFLTLLAECNRRVVLFYNKGRNYVDKRNESLQKFWELVNSRPGTYTSDHFQACVTQRNAIIAKFKLPAQTQFVQEQLSLAGQNIHKIMEMINNMSRVKDKSALEKTNSMIQSELDSLINKIQTILDEVQKNDNETGVMNTLREDLQTFLMEVRGKKELSENVKVKRLRDLAASLKNHKNKDSEKVHEGFSVAGICAAGSASVGGVFGLVMGSISLGSTAATAVAAGTALTAGAVVGTFLAPIVVVATVGGIAGYVFYTHLKLDGTTTGPEIIPRSSQRFEPRTLQSAVERRSTPQDHPSPGTHIAKTC